MAALTFCLENRENIFIEGNSACGIRAVLAERCHGKQE
jgi:hypothetical protein